jgi:DNA mismatch repair protein MutS
MSKLTPAMQQYYSAKKEHPDALIFFRMGDFYESFGEDARIIARELDITLTSRGRDKNGEKMPLAGIPYHAVDSYLPRLVRKGYKVAICEQLEDPKKARGVVKRGVVRIVTPGTAIDSSILTDPAGNYLMAVACRGNEFGVSFLDVSTGEFLTTGIEDTPPYDGIAAEISRMHPAECILPPSLMENTQLIRHFEDLDIAVHEFDGPDPDSARQQLLGHFGVSTLEGMGCDHLETAVCSAAAALTYANETQMRELNHVQAVRTYSNSEFMVLDSITLRNLEVIRNVRSSGKEATLLHVLDETSTPMGGRMLFRWLTRPLLDVDAINHRLDAVEGFFSNTLMRYDVRAHLAYVKDIERLVGRIVYGNANARDLIALKQSLEAADPILESLGTENHGDLIRDVVDTLTSFAHRKELTDLIGRAIVDEPPLSVRDGGMIKKDYNVELDELREISGNAKSWIVSFQQKERDRTGIKSLKVGYNKVFGYYIEVTKANSSLVPEDYIRKQTMTNAERFYTPLLKEWEGRILSADEKSVALEYDLFGDIISEVASHASALQSVASALGLLDVAACLAEVAANNNYVRPDIKPDCRILIREGRHPVVEKSVEGGFVPNDADMDCSDSQFLLITGPNMAGKSTYMRQVALITIMAQAGSFVPASHASIGIVDRVFTRVGAFDDLASGQSTFMVEMVELANILNNATPKSLILLDEIGRGTSTYDGYSIAKAVVEYIHNKGRVGVRTLFATHYHQLTELAGRLKRVKNCHIAVKEDGDDLVFLRRIVPGATDRSYGIHVARIAGVPRKVTRRAQEILEDIENESIISKENKSEKKRSSSAKYTQVVLFDPQADRHEDWLPEEIRALDPDNMTPVEALNCLCTLKAKLENKEESHD